MKYPTNRFTERFSRFYEKALDTFNYLLNPSFQYSFSRIPSNFSLTCSKGLEGIFFMSRTHKGRTAKNNRGGNLHRSCRIITISHDGKTRSVNLSTDKQGDETATACLKRVLDISRKEAVELLRRNH